VIAFSEGRPNLDKFKIMRLETAAAQFFRRLSSGLQQPIVAQVSNPHTSSFGSMNDTTVIKYEPFKLQEAVPKKPSLSQTVNNVSQTIPVQPKKVCIYFDGLPQKTNSVCQADVPETPKFESQFDRQCMTNP
jgi:hypothetical protein